jgi:CheY-like chemotaxis protein
VDKPIRLLVVDDHEDVRFLVKMIVGDHPEVIEVVGEAAGAVEAVEKLESGCDPDAVVLDARMPIHDGFEAAAMLLERRPDLVIVLLTAFVDDEIREKARSAGIREVLGKDEFDAIPATMARLLGREGPAPEPA